MSRMINISFFLKSQYVTKAMAGIVKSVDATLRSMNLEKVKEKLIHVQITSFWY